jgi:hypothetical protein
MELVKWPRDGDDIADGRQNQDHVSGPRIREAGIHDGRESETQNQECGPDIVSSRAQVEPL